MATEQKISKKEAVQSLMKSSGRLRNPYKLYIYILIRMRCKQEGRRRKPPHAEWNIKSSKKSIARTTTTQINNLWYNPLRELWPCCVLAVNSGSCSVTMWAALDICHRRSFDGRCLTTGTGTEFYLTHSNQILICPSLSWHDSKSR